MDAGPEVDDATEGRDVSDDPIIPRLSVENQYFNNAGGTTSVAIERPFKFLSSCAAFECTYVNIPTNVSVVIEPEASIGASFEYGGDCAPFNSSVIPCTVSMDVMRRVTVDFNGSG